MPHDEVKNPEWYRWHPITKKFGIECKHIIAHFPHHLGAAIKYIWRAGRKPGSDAIKDLRKAVEFLENEIRELETTKAPDEAFWRQQVKGINDLYFRVEAPSHTVPSGVKIK